MIKSALRRGLSGKRCFWPDTPGGGRREGLASDDGDTERCGEEEAAEQSAEQLAAIELVRMAREQGLSLTGPDGLLKQFTKTVLETALNEEMTEHLGHEKHDPAGAGAGNVRNGTRTKTVLTEATGQVEIEVPAGPGRHVRAADREEAAAAADRGR